MRMSATLTGGADLVKRLQQLPAAASKRVQREALRAGAEPMRAEMAIRAPRDPNSSAPHLADNIVVGTRTKTREREDETIVEVGPALQPSDHFYGYFQEYGTVHSPAQPFMRPAFDIQVHRSLNIVIAALWTAVKKKIGGTLSTGGRGL